MPFEKQDFRLVLLLLDQHIVMSKGALESFLTAVKIVSLNSHNRDVACKREYGYLV